MLGVTDLATYVVALILIILLPGPNSLYVLSVAARGGVGKAYQAAGGILVGDTILMTVAAMGGATLLQSSPAVFLVVKVIGAAYLVWIGLDLVRLAWRQWQQAGFRWDDASQALGAGDGGKKDAASPFRKALVVSLLNPKAIMFLLSFFIQFVDPAYPQPALSFLFLGALGQLFSLIYLSALIFAGARLAHAFRQRRRSASVATGAVGSMFVGFGAKLATATL